MKVCLSLLALGGKVGSSIIELFMLFQRMEGGSGRTASLKIDKFHLRFGSSGLQEHVCRIESLFFVKTKEQVSIFKKFWIEVDCHRGLTNCTIMVVPVYHASVLRFALFRNELYGISLQFND